MLLQVMKMSQTVKYQQQQLSVARRLHHVCDPRDAITVWQWRHMLSMSLWMAAISRLFHYKHCVILSKFLVVYIDILNY